MLVPAALKIEIKYRLFAGIRHRGIAKRSALRSICVCRAERIGLAMADNLDDIFGNSGGAGAKGDDLFGGAGAGGDDLFGFGKGADAKAGAGGKKQGEKKAGGAAGLDLFGPSSGAAAVGAEPLNLGDLGANVGPKADGKKEKKKNAAAGADMTDLFGGNDDFLSAAGPSGGGGKDGKKTAAVVPVASAAGANIFDQPASDFPKRASSASALAGQRVSSILAQYENQLDEDVTAFVNQAEKLKKVDEQIFANFDRLAKLNQEAIQAEQKQKDLTSKLEVLKASQIGLENDLQTVEKELQSKMVERDRTRADKHRQDTYNLAEQIDNQLTQLSRDIGEIVRSVDKNAVAPVDKNNPLASVIRICDNHTRTLEWIRKTADEVESNVAQVTRRMGAQR